MLCPTLCFLCRIKHLPSATRQSADIPSQNCCLHISSCGSWAWMLELTVGYKNKFVQANLKPHISFSLFFVGFFSSSFQKKNNSIFQESIKCFYFAKKMFTIKPFQLEVPTLLRVKLNKLQSSMLQVCLVIAGSEYRFRFSVFLENQTSNEVLSYSVQQCVQFSSGKQEQIKLSFSFCDRYLGLNIQVNVDEDRQLSLNNQVCYLLRQPRISPVS